MTDDKKGEGGEAAVCLVQAPGVHQGGRQVDEHRDYGPGGPDTWQAQVKTRRRGEGLDFVNTNTMFTVNEKEHRNRQVNKQENDKYPGH